MANQTLLFDWPATGHRISKRKAPSINRIKVDHELAKQRYYLHRRVKKYFPIDGAKRIIDIRPHMSLEELPKYPRVYIIDLIDFGYNVQIGIPHVQKEETPDA